MLTRPVCIVAQSPRAPLAWTQLSTISLSEAHGLVPCQSEPDQARPFMFGSAFLIVIRIGETVLVKTVVEKVNRDNRENELSLGAAQRRLASGAINILTGGTA